MGKIQLSVILPTFNCESTIIDCLESVTWQSFEDYEIIIKDGGSDDGTLAKIDNFRGKYPRVPIRVTSEPDKGIYDAMNKAVTLASGTWLYFLGSDDRLFDEQVIASVFSSIQSDEADLIYGNVSRIHSGELYMGKFDFEKLLIYNICHQSIFLKKELFLKYGPFDIRYFACADWDLNLRLFRNKVKVKYVDITVAYYNENGFSNVFRDDMFFEKLKEERKLYFSKWPNKLASLRKRAVNRIRQIFNVATNGGGVAS